MFIVSHAFKCWQLCTLNKTSKEWPAVCISAQKVHSIQSESRHLFAAGTSAFVGKIRTGMVLNSKSTAVNLCHKWYEEMVSIVVDILRPYLSPLRRIWLLSLLKFVDHSISLINGRIKGFKMVLLLLSKEAYPWLQGGIFSTHLTQSSERVYAVTLSKVSRSRSDPPNLNKTTYNGNCSSTLNKLLLWTTYVDLHFFFKVCSGRHIVCGCLNN